MFPLAKLFLMAALFCPVAFAQNKTVIRIPAEAIAEKDTISLGDIASITSADEGKATRLKEISLGYAPGIGTAAEISLERISLAIKSAGFNRSDFALDAPPKIIIKRAFQFVERDALREAVVKAVNAAFDHDKTKVTFVSFEIPGGAEVPAGKVEVKAKVESPLAFSGRFPVSIEIDVNGKVFRRFSAAANIEVEAEVFVAAKELVRGEKLTSDGLKTETRKIEKPLKNYIRDLGRLKGMILQRNVSAGEVITTDAVAAGYVIKTGDTVRITGQSGKMTISILGEARTSGRIGDRIAVKNSQSGAILQAIVEDEGLVKILF